MRRRELLTTGIATAATLAMPRLAGAARANTLVFVPTSDLAVLDPIVTFNRPTRNYAYLVFDTLYGIDTSWQAQPQMVAGHEVEDDGLTWQLRLREGLRFHDNEPVLARDVVASIRRFAPRISFATALMAATEELSASDDKTVKFRLKRPFPHLPAALAGPGGTVPAIMPERLAATSPYQPVKEIVGSGPYRFLADEHVSGARAAFGRFAEYRPRDTGALGFTSGPKVTHFDRVEWVTLDPFSAQGALGNGEIDWWESPARDLFAQVARDTNVAAVSHYIPAIDQNEAMIAIAGEDPADRYDGVGIFPTGTPLANDSGIEVMKRPRDYAAAKRALAAAGYKGEKIVIISPTDVGGISTLSRIGAEQLRRAGINVDFQEMDFGTVIRRRTNQAPPEKGGWNIFFTLIDRSIPNTNPFGNQALRTDGKAAWDGWPDSPKIEALRAAWLDAIEPAEQRRICAEMQTQLWQDLPFIPMGEYWQTTAYRKDLTGITPGCFTVFWGVRRT